VNLYDRARQELAMPTGTRDELIAAEAFVIGVHLWGLPAPSPADMRGARNRQGLTNLHRTMEYEKTVKKEGKQLVWIIFPFLKAGRATQAERYLRDATRLGCFLSLFHCLASSLN